MKALLLPVILLTFILSSWFWGFLKHTTYSCFLEVNQNDFFPLLRHFDIQGVSLSSPNFTTGKSYFFSHLRLDTILLGFPGSSDGKESTSNVRDANSIPGLGRSPGEGIGYPLQYFWASLVAQMVKNLPPKWVDPGLIPGFGRFPGEGYGNPLQFSFSFFN